MSVSRTASAAPPGLQRIVERQRSWARLRRLIRKAWMKSCVGRLVMESRADLGGIKIRAVRPDDRERIVNAFRALDPQSIHQRFFFPKRELSDEELRRLAECDRVRDVVLVATIGSGDRETIVGLGRYARSGAAAEIAFTVEEDYQGRGIASRLLRQLVHIARDNGILRFEADVLADNTPMLNVLHQSGLPLQKREADGVVHLTLFLGDGRRNA